MAASEIDGAHGLPRDIETLTNKLQKVLHENSKQIIGNRIKPQSAQRYAHKLIQRVNREDEEAE